jgi:hypothetical protein
LLGKYPIHFHLVRDSMRGSGVTGASIWDSHNHWLTIHGTDYLLVRDCVGYQSIGHGFFLEDATEQYNVLDRNLAVQAFAGQPLPKQALPFDRNEGAGFWWSNGRNTFTRNVACETERYGFFFEVTKRDGFQPVLPLRMPDGSEQKCDVRTIPFIRFEDNEAHSTRVYGIKFSEIGQDVRGDKQHPFIARNLKVWQTRYGFTPSLDYFLIEGLHVNHNSYGIRAPSLNMQVFRNVFLTNLSATIVGGRSPNYPAQDSTCPTASFENLTLERCSGHMGFSPSHHYAAHFRNLFVKDCDREGFLSDSAKRAGKYPNLAATYYFHDYPAPGTITKVTHLDHADKGAVPVEKIVKSERLRAVPTKPVAFPTLLEPVDDLPPATLITGVQRALDKLRVRGITHDNGDVAAVTVNDHPATVLSRQAGVVEWEVIVDLPAGGVLTAQARDGAANVEKLAHVLKVK